VPPESSLYDLLGVDPESDQNQIRVAYYAAIKPYHPDVDRNPAAHNQALKLVDAYRVLGDPDRREAYNARLRLEWPPFAEVDASPAGPRPASPDAAEHVAPAREAAADVVSAPEAVVAVYPEPEMNSETPWPASTPETCWFRHGRMVRATAAAAAFGIGFALLLLAFVTVKTLTERRTMEPPMAPAVAFALPASVSKSLVSPCLDLFSGLEGEQLYRECVKMRVKLHLRMMRLNAGEEMERDELQDAIAEIRQAVGAAGIKMTSTKGFIEESIAAFAEIKNSAKDQQVRRIAENYYYYYDCQALKHCAQ
jgi:hypothetical protein